MTSTEQSHAPPAGAGDGPLLEASGIVVRFGGLTALSGVTIQVAPRAITGLVGPNGAGKTTLFGVLSGLLRPNAGAVFLGGAEVTNTRPPHGARMGLARTFQQPELFAGLSTRDHLVIADRLRHEPRRLWTDLVNGRAFRRPPSAETARVDEILEMLRITSIANRAVLGLPLGMRRLVEVGRALATAPKVVLLDEPSSGLDRAETAALGETLRTVVADSGVAFVMVEHDVDLVLGLSQRVYVLDFGLLIAEGTSDEIRASETVRAAYLGDEPIEGVETSTEAMLVVEGLDVEYGPARALRGVALDVPTGSALAVLGANGAGKSTLARTVSGLVAPTAGRIHFDGRDVTGWRSHRLRRAGMVHLPEGRAIFVGLTVADNLRIGIDLVSRRDRSAALDRAFELFPVLADRRSQRAGSLSGGEQQMLALARALAVPPKMVIADEPSLGLAPLVVDLVFASLARARAEGATVILIEQFVHRALGFADHCVILRRGEVAWQGPASSAAAATLEHYIGEQESELAG